jgi:hypothetical protein
MYSQTVLPKASLHGSVSGSATGMGRFDLTDFEWSVIQPLLPLKAP